MSASPPSGPPPPPPAVAHHASTATTPDDVAQETPVRVVVAGHGGRMGRVITEQLPREGIEIVGTLGRGDEIAAALTTSRADVVVDFTDASYAPTLMREAIRVGVRPVSGTTGLPDGVLDEIDVLARQHDQGAVWAPHFSRAGVLLMHFARIGARFMNSVEIVETHDVTKADAPSGTARELVRIMRDAHRSDLADSPSHVMVDGVRGEVDAGVHVHSIRAGDVFGSHELIFGGTREVLTVRWDVFGHDSEVGAVAYAVRQVVKPGAVGLIRGYDTLMGLVDP